MLVGPGVASAEARSTRGSVSALAGAGVAGAESGTGVVMA